jgi:5-methyltetrahydropteroyltriglutamate--homocysteine methyltransferase
LMRKIEAASKFAPLEQLALSPQCGFASSIQGNPLGEAEQEAKLRRIVEVAGHIWGSA